MKYHLIGIGGTGMGALAGLLRQRGYDVRGSDTALYPPMSDQLAAMDIPVFSGFSAENVAWGPDVVVVGNVCRKEHVEVVEAQRLGIALKSMPQVLGEEFLADKRSLVVTGTHGKTTTTSLLAYILREAGREPGMFVGGVPLNFGQGFRYGGGDEFVVEGDEYDTAFFDKGSKFLHYRPHTAVLTSIELDHLDIFPDLEAISETFRKFVSLIPEHGLVVVCAASPEAMAVARQAAQCRVETYAVAGTIPAEDEPAVTWLARNVTYTKSGRCGFELWRQGQLFGNFETLLVGRHNVANVTAAVAVAASLGLAPGTIRRGIHGFAGVKRRQEVVGIAQGVYVIDDYAHHPTAVRETLEALRKRFPRRRIMAVFEPRSATTRRRVFQDDYAKALSYADSVVIGRMFHPEQIPEADRLDPDKVAVDIHRSHTPATYLPDTDSIVKHLVSSCRSGDVIAVLSSGSFDGLHQKLLAALGDAVRPAARRDMQDVIALALEVGWPLGEITEDMFPNFFVLHNEHGFTGCVALEVYGEAAILRSLAVKPVARGGGYGWMLAETAVSAARHRGVHRIYLVTENASDFFAQKLGFRVVDASTVSPAVANAPIFRSHANRAIAMRLDL